MKKVQILVFANHPGTLNEMMQMINENPLWQADGRADGEEVIELLQRNTYDLVLLDGSLTEIQVRKIRAVIHAVSPTLKTMLHFGGGRHVLYHDIEHALRGNAGEKFRIMDNPFV